MWTLVDCTHYWHFHTLHLMLTVELWWFQPQLWAFNFSIVSSSFFSCSSSTQWGFSPSRWSNPSVILSLVFFDVKSVTLLSIHRLAPTFPKQLLSVWFCILLRIYMFTLELVHSNQGLLGSLGLFLTRCGPFPLSHCVWVISSGFLVCIWGKHHCYWHISVSSHPVSPCCSGRLLLTSLWCYSLLRPQLIQRRSDCSRHLLILHFLWPFVYHLHCFDEFL